MYRISNSFNVKQKKNREKIVYEIWVALKILNKQLLVFDHDCKIMSDQLCVWQFPDTENGQ